MSRRFGRALTSVYAVCGALTTAIAVVGLVGGFVRLCAGCICGYCAVVIVHLVLEVQLCGMRICFAIALTVLPAFAPHWRAFSVAVLRLLSFGMGSTELHRNR